jgi:hypothetical protein
MLKILLADDHSAIRQRLLSRSCWTNIPVRRSRRSPTATGFANGHALRRLGSDHCRHFHALSERTGGLPPYPGTKFSLPVLLLSIYCDEDYASHAIKAGASAYLCKENAQDELIKYRPTPYSINSTNPLDKSVLLTYIPDYSAIGCFGLILHPSNGHGIAMTERDNSNHLLLKVAPSGRSCPKRH